MSSTEEPAGAADSVDRCPLDSRLWDDHTMAEARQCGQQLHDHTLEYEEIAGGATVEQSIESLLAGSVMVKAGVIDGGPTGVHPVLVFEFATPAGPLTPVTLVLDDNRMRDFRRVVGGAIDGALKAARRAR